MALISSPYFRIEPIVKRMIAVVAHPHYLVRSTATHHCRFWASENWSGRAAFSPSKGRVWIGEQEASKPKMLLKPVLGAELESDDVLGISCFKCFAMLEERRIDYL